MMSKKRDAPASSPARIGDGSDLLSVFIARVYVPHAMARKRSWLLDERIARRHILPSFGARRLCDISRADVDDWLGSLRSGGYSPASCNRFLAVFKSLCALAEARGLPGGNPCAGVSAFRAGFARSRHLEAAEAGRLMRELAQSRSAEARALELLLLTGARKGEILKARWENIDFGRRLLTVPLSKSGHARHIALSRAAMRVIASLPSRGRSPWLFPGRNPDRPRSDIYVFWNRLRQRLGLGSVRIHDLRHSFASFLVNAGHSLYEVQKLLGHRDPRTTMRYAHLGNEALLAATESVSALLGANQEKKEAEKTTR